MDTNVLNEARRLADEIFRPKAEESDRGDIHGIVGSNIRLLADAGYFGLGIDPKYGGFGAGDAARREYAELIASACGVTAFTQQQLHSGGGFFGGAQDQEARAEMLPKFAAGELLCGVGFSHLRRPGPPMVTARKVDGGVIVSGSAPWVTGWSILDGFVLGAVEEGNAKHMFIYVAKAGNENKVTAGAPMALLAMNASDTVEVAIDDLFVPQRFVLSERPAEAMRRADFCGITGHVYLPLGCARGSIHYMRSLAEKRNSPEIAEAANAFECEVDACRAEALRWNGSCADLPEYKEHAMHARTWAIVLSVRAAHAAVAATGGAAQLLTSPAQRLMREATFLTTIAQTEDVRIGTLDMLVSPDCWHVE